MKWADIFFIHHFLTKTKPKGNISIKLQSGIKKVNFVTMRKLGVTELNRLSQEEVKEAKKAPFVVVLDNIRSLNNVGSAFRTSDAFGIEKIVLCGITGTPPHRDIHKTALGAQETVEWEYAESTKIAIEKLKLEGYKIALIEQIDTSISLEKYSFSKEEPTALVFGNEVFGVSEDVLELADVAIEIPQFGAKHSLNVSVTIGVVLWQAIH